MYGNGLERCLIEEALYLKILISSSLGSRSEIESRVPKAMIRLYSGSDRNRNLHLKDNCIKVRVACLRPGEMKLTNGPHAAIATADEPGKEGCDGLRDIIN